MTDPLAGIPVNSRATSTKVIPIAAARAKLKRRKLTGDEYKTARDQARTLTGYDPATSAIKALTTIEVLTDISRYLDGMDKAIDANDRNNLVQRAKMLNEELRKRLLSRQLTFKP